MRAGGCGFTLLFVETNEMNGVNKVNEVNVIEKIKQVIDEIRPYIRADGGDIELIGIEEGTVTVRLTGACEGCMASSYTLQAGVERILKDRVSEVKEVITG